MQAKTPRPWKCHLVTLAGGAGQPLGKGEISAPTQRVIAQVVDRLAHLGKRRRDRAPAFANDERYQLSHLVLEEIGGSLQNGGPFAGPACDPKMMRREVARASARSSSAGPAATTDPT